jgi:WD40 repeat protein
MNITVVRPNSLKLRWVVCLILSLCAAKNFAQLQFPPGLKWRTLETEHALIYYPQTHAELAEKIAIKAEQIHALTSSVMKHIPDVKTHIVLNDCFDLTFGATSYLFYNAIYISPVQPALGLGHYEDYLDFVLLHEYCHVMDADMIGGVPELVRMCVGRLYSPNMFSPDWMVEGLATYLETELTRGGRGIDPYSDMVLRMAFLENHLPHLDQNNLFWDQWPGGTTAYLNGESLYRHMAKNNVEKVVLFRHDNSCKLWPFSFGGGLGYYWDNSIPVTYEQWKITAHKKYTAQKWEITSQPITPFKRLTHMGTNLWGIEWTQDGKGILFFDRTYDEHAFLYRVDVERRTVRKLNRTNASLPQLTMDKNGKKLYFSQLELHDKNALYSDICSIEMNSNRVDRVTVKRRAADPDVNGCGDLVYVVYCGGKTDLCLQKTDGQEALLLKGTDGLYFSNPRFSPDEKKIALSVWRKGGIKEIWVMELESRKYRAVTQDSAWNITPSWSCDGETILFASDRTGVYNLFAYRLADNALFQLTNVLGGAFCPRMSHDGKTIAFVGYFSQGFEVCTMDAPDMSQLTPVNHPEAVLKKSASFVYGYRTSHSSILTQNQTHSVIPAATASKKYNPLYTLVKPIRIPMILVDDTSSVLGVWLLGKDVLNQHMYSILAAYSIGHERPLFTVDYMNAQYYPNILLHAEDMILPHEKGSTVKEEDDNVYWEHSRKYSVGLELPVTKLDYQLVIGLGLDCSKYNGEKTNATDANLSFFQGRLGSLVFGTEFSNARQYLRSIYYEEGFLLGTQFHWYTKALLSDFSFYLGQVYFQKFFRMPSTRHHVLSLRMEYYRTDIQKTENQFSLLTARIRGFREIQWRKNLYGGTAEYHLPVVNIERGYSTWPLYLRKIHGSLFMEYWHFTDPHFDEKKSASYGMELNADFVAGYRFPLTLTFGYAKPWKGDPGTYQSQVYWKASLNTEITSHLFPKTYPSGLFGTGIF